MMNLANKLCALRLAGRKGSATVLALLVSLLLMVLVSGTVALTMVDAQTTQDYARNRTSFEGADSGVQHGRKVLSSALQSWNLPVATTVDDVAQYTSDANSGVTTNNKDISLLTDNATQIQSLLPRNTQKTAKAWQQTNAPTESYGVNYNITPNGVDLPASTDISDAHTFHYNYSINSKGASDIQAQHNQATRTETGTFDVKVSRPSFATYGYFTDSMKNQNNQQLWFYDGETYDGPTMVNGAPPTGQAAFWGSATFKGAFSAVQGSYNDSILGGNANPQFLAGATWGAQQIPVPQNGWNQLRASVGDLNHIDDPSPPSNSELRTDLGLTVNNNPVPGGVYYSANNNTGSDLLGGIFVNGDASQVQFSKSGSDQIINVTATAASGPFQGTHTWSFHDNAASNSSYVTYDGGSTQFFNQSLNGVIHVNGQVLNLAGDGNATSADIQRDHQITVSANNNIYVGDNITYEQDPVANPSTRNVLGIFSATGNVLLAQNAPNNLTVNATVMAASTGHGVGSENIVVNGQYDYNYPNKGNWNLTGGLIEDTNQTTGVFFSDGTLTGYRWNFTYDQRFSSGVAPPYFPYVSKFVLQMMGIQHKSWGRKYY